MKDPEQPRLQPPPLVKFPTRVEWENEAVDVFVDDDDEALLMTAQDGVRIKYSLRTKNQLDFYIIYYDAQTTTFLSILYQRQHLYIFLQRVI